MGYDMGTKNLIASVIAMLAVAAVIITFVVAVINSERTEAQKQQQMYAQCVAAHSPGDCRYILPEAN